MTVREIEAVLNSIRGLRGGPGVVAPDFEVHRDQTIGFDCTLTVQQLREIGLAFAEERSPPTFSIDSEW